MKEKLEDTCDGIRFKYDMTDIGQWLIIDFMEV
jgi:hypothetical protein